jgi:hypothetical protein
MTKYCFVITIPNNPFDVEVDDDADYTDVLRGYADMCHRFFHKLADAIDKLIDKDWDVEYEDELEEVGYFDFRKACTQEEAEADLIEAGLSNHIDKLLEWDFD